MVDALGAIGLPAVPGLLHMLQDPKYSIRSAGVLALKNIGALAIPGLIQNLEDTDLKSRWYSMDILITIGLPAVPYLIQALENEDRVVGWAAARALVKINAPKTALAVFQSIKPDEDSMIDTALKWYSEIGIHDYDAIWDIIGTVHLAAVRALGEIGTPEVVPDLLRALHDWDWLIVS